MEPRRATALAVAGLCLLAACGDSEDPSAETGHAFCEAVQEFREGFLAIDPSLPPAERNLEVNRLAVDLERTAPAALQDDIATISTVDLTAVSGPNSSDGEHYQQALAALAEFIEGECGITTEE